MNDDGWKVSFGCEERPVANAPGMTLFHTKVSTNEYQLYRNEAEYLAACLNAALAPSPPAETAEERQAKIVKWLRIYAALQVANITRPWFAGAIDELADTIERGDWKEPTDGN